MINTIYHRQWGEGEPLVLIHGLFGSMENLGMIAQRLKSQYCVYTLDLPNHGRSQHTKDTSLLDMAEAIIDWMDALELKSAHFLGHSLGGKVSMELALHYPERVQGLIVADISPIQYPRRHDDIFAAFRDVELDKIKHRTDAYHAMEKHVNDIPTRDFLLKNLVKKKDHWQWRMNLELLERNYEAIITGNSREFPSFNNHVLFIKGERSDYILPEHKKTILQLFPKASVKVIHNTEHWLHAEKPDIFTGIVKRFLS